LRTVKTSASLPLVIAAVTVGIGIVVGVTQSTRPEASSLAASTSPSAGPIGGQSVPYQLYTHCGIDEALIGDVYFEADQPLMVEYGPPPGWGNPEQSGRMTVLDDAHAVFRDDVGHEVHFHARPGATDFKLLCD
jgi:hypothetical protein